MRDRKPSRILGYARVSSVDQAVGTSLQDQQDAIRAYARSRGIEVAGMYVEAESAVHEKIERREQIRALLVEVRSGDLVVCDKLDRWSRDPEFTYGSIRKILGAGAAFFAVGDNCDPSTYEGDTMLNVRVLVAREEHKRIKQRMVGTRRLLRDRGYYVEGLPPWGYRRQQVRGAERNTLIVDELEASRIRRAFRLCVAGRSLTEVADALEEKRDRLADALHNRLYLGEAKDSRGQWITGRQPAIVDAALFMAAQDALAGRRFGSRPPAEGAITSTWWLRDVARCGLCGAKMSAAYGGRARPGRRYYLFCRARCHPKFLRVEVAEASCAPLVEARLLELRAELATCATPATSAVGSDVPSRLAKLQARRERHLEAFAEGLSTREELRAAMAKLDVERTRLEALQAPAPAPTAAQRRSALEDVAFVTKQWRRADPRVRREIANLLMRRAGLALGVEPAIDWKSADELALVKEE